MGDEEHDPTEQDGGADEEDKAVGSVVEHPAWFGAHGDAEDSRGAEGKEQHRGEVRRMQH